MMRLVRPPALGSRPRGLFRFALLLAFTVALSFAHTELVKSSPAANSAVSAPESVTLQFSGALEAKFSKITVLDGAGRTVNKVESVVGTDAKVISVALPGLVPGVYTVRWVAVSTDSHRSQGQYKFTVK